MSLPLPHRTEDLPPSPLGWYVAQDRSGDHHSAPSLFERSSITRIAKADARQKHRQVSGGCRHPTPSATLTGPTSERESVLPSAGHFTESLVGAHCGRV